MKGTKPSLNCRSFCRKMVLLAGNKGMMQGVDVFDKVFKRRKLKVNVCKIKVMIFRLEEQSFSFEKMR